MRRELGSCGANELQEIADQRPRLLSRPQGIDVGVNRLPPDRFVDDVRVRQAGNEFRNDGDPEPRRDEARQRRGFDDLMRDVRREPRFDAALPEILREQRIREPQEYEALAVQIGEVDGRHPGEAVAFGQDEGDGLTPGPFAGKVEVLGWAAQETDVGLSGLQHRDLAVRRHFVDPQRDVGIGDREVANGAPEGAGQHRPCQADIDDAGRTGTDGAGAPDGFAGLLQDVERLHEEVGARPRQRHATGRPFEQRGADLCLEITDLLAQGRLGDTEARGGGGEAEMPGDGREVAKVPEFHTPSYIRKISIETDEIFDVWIAWQQAAAAAGMPGPTCSRIPVRRLPGERHRVEPECRTMERPDAVRGV